MCAARVTTPAPAAVSSHGRLVPMAGYTSTGSKPQSHRVPKHTVCPPLAISLIVASTWPLPPSRVSPPGPLSVSLSLSQRTEQRVQVTKNTVTTAAPSSQLHRRPGELLPSPPHLFVEPGGAWCHPRMGVCVAHHPRSGSGVASPGPRTRAGGDAEPTERGDARPERGHQGHSSRSTQPLEP